MGKWTSRFAQCEMQVMDVHHQLVAAMRATEGPSGSPIHHLVDAPLHRMLDRANDYLAEHLATKTGPKRLEDSALVRHGTHEELQKNSGIGGGEFLDESEAEGRAQQACCIPVLRIHGLLLQQR